ncbi:hypothetical protein, partial [Asaia bogorensis]|uniref:hypothetical protein n=1 Tax=Asaia bogorensis TaxID=91915 RepID=UPI00197C6FFF
MRGQSIFRVALLIMPMVAALPAYAQRGGGGFHGGGPGGGGFHGGGPGGGFHGGGPGGGFGGRPGGWGGG